MMISVSVRYDFRCFLAILWNVYCDHGRIFSKTGNEQREFVLGGVASMQVEIRIGYRWGLSDADSIFSILG